MLLDVLPFPDPAEPNYTPIVIMVVVVLALLGLALWRYFRKRR